MQCFCSQQVVNLPEIISRGIGLFLSQGYISRFASTLNIDSIIYHAPSNGLPLFSLV